MNRQPNRPSISRISLIAADKRAHYLCVQQSNAVAQCLQFTCPMVSTTTRFDGDQARLAVGEMLQNFCPLDLHIDDLTHVHVDRMQLKHLFGNIKPKDLLPVHRANHLSCAHPSIAVHDRSSVVFVKTVV